MKKLSWFHENKVLLIGLLTSVALPLYDLVKNGETSMKVLIVAFLGAATSYLARNLRGQVATLMGIAGTMLATYVTNSPEHPVSWAQIVLQAVILYLASVAPPAKSVGYERAPEIVEAKREGEVIKPTLADPTPTKI